MSSNLAKKLVMAAAMFFPCFALAAPPADQYRQSIAEAPLGDDLEKEISSRVKTTLSSLVLGILHEVNGAPFTAHQFLGFSGAGYADINSFEASFRAEVQRRNEETVKTLGTDAKTVLIMGGTVDGFGRGYEIIENLKATGAIKNVLVVGMSSNQAVGYHLEGIEKGWGDVISPRQDQILLKETYQDSEGNKSWELKSSPISESDTPKILKDLSRFPNAGLMTFNVFGGGAQAFNETMELILEARNRNAKVEINLHIGFLPGKPKKDTGYRASDMLAYALAKNPDLLTKNISLNIRQKDKVTTLSNYRRTTHFKTYSANVSQAKAAISSYQNAEATPENQAAIKYFKILEHLDALPLNQIQTFRARSSQELASAREQINQHLKVDSDLTRYEAFMSRSDICTRCVSDAEELEKIMRASTAIISCKKVLLQ